MYIYCKRNKYISKKFFGKNNKGHITIRSKQKLFIKLTQLKNINYNYYFFKNIKNYIDINKKLIKLQIIDKVLDNNLQRYVYKVLC